MSKEGNNVVRRTGGILRNLGTTAIAALLLVQLVGLRLSALLLAATFATRDQVAARLESFAVDRVEAYALKQLEGLGPHLEGVQDQGGALGRLAGLLGDRARVLEESREELVPQIVALTLSRDCESFCVPESLLPVIADVAIVQWAAQLRLGESTVQDLIAQRYKTTIRGLTNDLRRFGAVNMVAFALMIGLVLARQLANWRFVAFSVTLLAVTLYMSYWYAFGQDWVQVILFQNWAAVFYQGSMIFACGVMFDWLFLRGRLTEMVMNTLSSMGN